jgi:hypothetical protein
MRGSELFRIWETKRPNLYANKSPGVDQWRVNRSLRQAGEALDYIGVPYDSSHSPYVDDAWQWDLDHIHLGNADGQCRMCLKDIDHCGFFCSEKCETAFKQLLELRKEKMKWRCRICGTTYDPIEHHIDYDDEKKIGVCSSCHGTITARQGSMPELSPKKPKEKKEYVIPEASALDLFGTLGCVKCGAKFNSQSDYQNHYLAFHKPGRKTKAQLEYIRFEEDKKRSERILAERQEKFLIKLKQDEENRKRKEVIKKRDDYSKLVTSGKLSEKSKL